MAAYQKFQPFLEAVHEGKHNFATAQLRVALSNTAPAAGNAVLADIAEIAYTNLSSRALTIASSSQTGGVYSVVVNDLTLTSTGGPTGPFRYVVVYNDSAAADDLICFYDRGESITLADGETLTLDFGAQLFTNQ